MSADSRQALAQAVGSSAWLCVDEAQPMTYDSVIVWGRLEGEARPDAHEGFWTGIDWWSVRQSEDDPLAKAKIDQVTHWMPRPPAPNESSSATRRTTQGVTMQANQTETDGQRSLKRVLSRRGHVLHTIFTCPCDKESDSPCCICDMGLAVCRICGAAECELDERDCTGEPANAIGEPAAGSPTP